MSTEQERGERIKNHLRKNKKEEMDDDDEDEEEEEEGWIDDHSLNLILHRSQ
jgi:hypothetical protein